MKKYMGVKNEIRIFCNILLNYANINRRFSGNQIVSQDGNTQQWIPPVS
jgi:hypothetical protein